MILRNIIVALALLWLAASLIGAMADATFWPMAAMSAVVVALLLFERHRYQQNGKAPPREQLRPTAEVFIDPETDRPIRVWLDSAGKRYYLDEPEGAGR